MSRRIYLAGPEVFLPNAKEEGRRLKKLCAEAGFVGCFPLDNQADTTCALDVYLADIKLLETCDIIIANMSPFRGLSMDPGTAFELGYAAANGFTIAGWSNNLRPYHERAIEQRWDDGLYLEEWGLHDNLMVCVPARPVWASFEVALASLKGI